MVLLLTTLNSSRQVVLVVLLVVVAVVVVVVPFVVHLVEALYLHFALCEKMNLVVLLLVPKAYWEHRLLAHCNLLVAHQVVHIPQVQQELPEQQELQVLHQILVYFEVVQRSFEQYDWTLPLLLFC
jgi:hypothetical protein